MPHFHITGASQNISYMAVKFSILVSIHSPSWNHLQLHHCGPSLQGLVLVCRPKKMTWTVPMMRRVVVQDDKASWQCEIPGDNVIVSFSRGACCLVYSFWVVVLVGLFCWIFFRVVCFSVLFLCLSSPVVCWLLEVTSFVTSHHSIEVEAAAAWRRTSTQRRMRFPWRVCFFWSQRGLGEKFLEGFNLFNATISKIGIGKVLQMDYRKLMRLHFFGGNPFIHLSIILAT